MADFIVEPQNGLSPLKIYNQVKTCAQFTPEFALDVLKQTNNPRVMDALFEKIKTALNDGADYFSYRSALLGMVAARECRDNIKDKIQAIADANNDKATFDEIAAFPVFIGRNEGGNHILNLIAYGQKVSCPPCYMKNYSGLVMAPNVKEADLSGCRDMPVAVADFSCYTQLRKLCLKGIRFRDDVAPLKLPSGLEYVDVSNMKHQIYDWSVFENLHTLVIGLKKNDKLIFPPNLQNLHLTDAQMEPNTLDKLKDCQTLRWLKISYGTSVTGVKGAYFELPQTLEELALHSVDDLDDRMFQLDKYPNLKKIELVSMELEGRKLSLPTNIEELNLDFAKNAEPQVFDFRKYTKLKMLSLQHVNLHGARLKLPQSIEELTLHFMTGATHRILDLSAYPNLRKVSYLANFGETKPDAIRISEDCVVAGTIEVKKTLMSSLRERWGKNNSR